MCLSFHNRDCNYWFIIQVKLEQNMTELSLSKIIIIILFIKNISSKYHLIIFIFEVPLRYLS